jgi:hypothetical protein
MIEHSPDVSHFSHLVKVVGEAHGKWAPRH